ncbi:DUF742 domain-containing protein [Euzebya sp.]|uniref:DUF742 domain-containing protein n=1 Tax=Euzebya sp. TaxID=1971409 RepID=UPI003517B58B
MSTPPVDGGSQDWSRLTRPYALTGGRTEPVDADLALESLVEMTWEGYDALDSLTFEKRDIIRLTQETVSVAELAAHLRVPLGVARVLVADLADAGYVVVHPPPEGAEGGQDPNLLEKVLDGLRSL